MSKRTPEEIIHSVERYQRGETSQGAEAKRLGVSRRAFQDWIRKYETFGAEGFEHTGNRKYSSELKASAVQDYLNGEGSHAAICKKYGISSRKQLRNWIKVYNGHKELRPSSGRGSNICMTKGRTTTYEERVEIVSFCIERGNDYTATIEKCGVSYQQIYSWVRKYNEKGVEGLVDKRGKRKAESEMTEVEKLRAENRMLEAQNRRLETECAVLKKLEEIERRWH
jgi:transposase